MKQQLENITKKINKLNPDIIIFTGDLLDKNISLTENTEKEEVTTNKETIVKEDTSNKEQEKEINIPFINYFLLFRSNWVIKFLFSLYYYIISNFNSYKAFIWIIFLSFLIMFLCFNCI